MFIHRPYDYLLVKYKEFFTSNYVVLINLLFINELHSIRRKAYLDPWNAKCRKVQKA